MQQKFSLPLSLAFYLVASSLQFSSALAQVTPDGTTNTSVDVSGNDFTINQGERAGGNLFHSFGEFSVPTDGSAFFNNAADIVNIFSRVTGGNISNIDGLLGANGTANLFLINPAGIIFGEGARLNIGGSFYGSTADSIIFSDGEFSASDLANPPLITINAPIGLNFRDNPEGIVNRSFVQDDTGDVVGLEVISGQNLTLVGGNINFETGNATASGGNIELGGLSTEGTVGINDDGSLSFPKNVAKVDITLSNGAGLDVTGIGEGTVTINARNISLEAGEFGGSFIRAGSTSTDTQAGDITINATQNVTVDESIIVNEFFSASVGNAGNIIIIADSLSLTNIGRIGTSALSGPGNAGDIIITINSLSLTNGGVVDAITTFGQGNGGNIIITASDTITIDGESSEFGLTSGISSGTFNAVGDAGDITITTTNLSLTNGGVVLASNGGLSQGNGGSVEIIASDTITIDGESLDGSIPSGISSEIGSEAVGDAGSINIITSNLNLTNGGQITANTLGQGNGGNITITASDTITIDGESLNGSIPSSVNTEVDSGAVGDAGSINIITSDINLTNGGQIEASTFGEGNAGDIKINASKSASIINGRILSRVQTTSTTGNGGNIEIDTKNLSLGGSQIDIDNGGRVSRIDSGTRGTGNAGDIRINASESINISGLGVISSASTNREGITSIGNSGNIDITTRTLNLNDSGFITSDLVSEGIRKAGNININASDSITLNGGSISSRIFGAIEGDTSNILTGDAGNITITTGNLILKSQAGISTTTDTKGNAGNIKILAIGAITISDLFSGIFSNTIGRGNGGNIDITSGNFNLTNLARLDSSTAGGDAGDITITTDNLSLLSGGTITAGTSVSPFNEVSTGNGGDISITVTDAININGEFTINGFTAVSLIDSSTFDKGNAGNINIATNNFTLTDGGSVSVATFGQGDAGSVNITASDTITIDSIASNGVVSAITSNTSDEGNAGDINILASEITIEDVGTIEAGNIDSFGLIESGIGEPGNINIQANSLSLTNEARINAATQSETGNTANINLQLTEDLTLRDNSFISARALENADGGNLNINARFILGFPSSGNGNGNDIIATAERGNGGDITINARQLFNLQEGRAIDENGNFIPNNRNDIDASSQAEGLDGTISIFTPDVNPLQRDVEAPSNIIESEQTVAQACQIDRTSDKPSGLIVKGKGGVPPKPTEPFDSNILVDEEITTSNLQANHPEIKPIKTSNGNIYPARGIIKTESGKIILTAYPTDNINTRTPHNSANCTPL